MEKGILAICERGHQQRILTPDHSRESAEMLASLMDASGEIYLVTPKEKAIPGSPLCRCNICGAWVHCSVFGYAEGKSC